MLDYPERHEKYVHQWQLLTQAQYMDIPVLVHDQDHKISEYDLEKLRKMDNVTIASPQLFLDGYRSQMSLMYPNFFFSAPIDLRIENREWTLSYVGNNYERYEQTVRMYGPLSRVFPTAFWGNWLEPGADGRTDPEIVKKDLPYVEFQGRCDVDMVFKHIADSLATVHLAKASYCQTGFVTMRWAEAAAAGTLAFIPKAFNLPPYWKQLFDPLIVDNGYEIADRLAAFSLEDIGNLIQTQRDFVHAMMAPENWVIALKSLVKEVPHEEEREDGLHTEILPKLSEPLLEEVA